MTLQYLPGDCDVIESPKPAVRKPFQGMCNAFYRAVSKPLIDKLLTLMAMPFALIVILPAAFLIFASDGRNPFYSQLRVGRNGQVFRLWKLRTMVYDADSQLEAYLAANPAAREEWELKQKLKEDPRVTAVGHFLRKTSLDELPQLWNVFAGHMSLVGPRPMMPNQRKDYSGQAYFNLRPGITGLWQVSDRNNCRFGGRVHYDDLYDRKISLPTDLGVMMRTVGVVLRGTGC